MTAPLFDAPEGQVWAFTAGQAHLVTKDALCGLSGPWKTTAFQVGGVTAQPCMDCIAAMWKQMVKRETP